jgi:hypothetical protein
MATANSPAPAPATSAASKWRPVLSRFARISLFVALAGTGAGAVEGALIALLLGGNSNLDVCLTIAMDRALALGLLGLGIGVLAALLDALWRLRKRVA